MMINDFGFQWHITDRCFNRCKHCYQTNFDGTAELNMETLIDMADDIMATANGAPVTVNITGGEPLLYGCEHKIDKNKHNGVYNNSNNRNSPAVFELMTHLSAFDNISELNIITSAMTMNSSTVNALKSVPKLTNVKVSLESHEPRVNDFIRNIGHYNTVTKNIAALAQAGLSVIIMATLGKYNYQSIDGLCALAAKLGATGVIFERYVPLGRGVALKDSALTSREWNDVLHAICRVAGMNADIDITDMLQYKAFFVDMSRGATCDDISISGAPCCLGASMAIMPNGVVYPCRRVPVPVGKMPGDKMRNILKTLSGFSTMSQLCFDFDF